MRNKNPSIPVDRKNRYNRTVPMPGSGRMTHIEYDACLVDSEDIDLISVTDVDGYSTPALWNRIQGLLDNVDCTLRAELAEWSDYVEAHR